MDLVPTPHGGFEPPSDHVNTTLASPELTTSRDNHRMKVLVAEDDKDAAEALRWGLSEVGIAADVVYNGHDALTQAERYLYDAVILDVMLPGGLDGFAVCRRLRDLRIPSKVMMLTARDGVIDRVAGLDSGADDYLIKPFAFAELLARLRALARRDNATTDTAVGDVAIDEVARTAKVGPSVLLLSRKEFDLLALLAQHAGRVVTHERIHDQGWGYERTPNSGLVDVYMSRLRKKLAATGSVAHIVNVRGVGYRLEVADE
jgi:two-component system OmpR family response regulator